MDTFVAGILIGSGSAILITVTAWRRAESKLRNKLRRSESFTKWLLWAAYNKAAQHTYIGDFVDFELEARHIYDTEVESDDYDKR